MAISLVLFICSPSIRSSEYSCSPNVKSERLIPAIISKGNQTGHSHKPGSILLHQALATVRGWVLQQCQHFKT